MVDILTKREYNTNVQIGSFSIRSLADDIYGEIVPLFSACENGNTYLFDIANIVWQSFIKQELKGEENDLDKAV